MSSLTNSDYKKICEFYNISTDNMSKTKLKREAESILANKLCRCIKSVDPSAKDEPKAIAVCNKSIFTKRNLKHYRFTCKKGARLLPKQGSKISLEKTGTISLKKSKKV